MDLKCSTRGFFSSLIMNQSSEFRNSKWRMQFSARTCNELLHSDDIWYSGVFVVADYESELRIQKFKIADPLWLTKLSLKVS